MAKDIHIEMKRLEALKDKSEQIQDTVTKDALIYRAILSGEMLRLVVDCDSRVVAKQALVSHVGIKSGSGDIGVGDGTPCRAQVFWPPHTHISSLH